MSEILHIDLPEGPAVHIPKGSGFIPVYDKPLPTNIQVGETWSFERISARFRAILKEKEPEKAEEINIDRVGFETEEEALNFQRRGTPLTSQEIIAAGINNPREKKVITYQRLFEATHWFVKTEQKITTERSTFPCPVSVLIELYDQDGTIGSMTIEGVFRWFLEEAGLYSGQCEFSAFSDLTNPITIGIEKVSLRISLFVPLSVASEAELKSATAAGSSGSVDLIYAKEVK